MIIIKPYWSCYAYDYDYNCDYDVNTEKILFLLFSFPIDKELSICQLVNFSVLVI